MAITFFNIRKTPFDELSDTRQQRLIDNGFLENSDEENPVVHEIAFDFWGFIDAMRHGLEKSSFSDGNLSGGGPTMGGGEAYSYEGGAFSGLA